MGICHGRRMTGRVAHALGSMMINSGSVLTRWRWDSLWLWQVVVVRRYSVRVWRRWLGVRRRHRRRMFSVRGAWGLIPAVSPTARRRWFTLLLFNNDGSNAGALGRTESARIRVGQGVAARWFTVGYVNRIATRTSGIGGCRIMSHLLLRL
jgi:hypothetical protein